MQQPFIAMLVFYIVATALLAGGYSLPTTGHTCPTTQVPATNARGVNRLSRSSNTPLYRLEIISNLGQNLSTVDSMSYRVQISTENAHLPFSDAKISLASKSPCDIGSLTFDAHDFFDARQSRPTCPRLLLTNRKIPMGGLPPLTWKPPACGCILFRAVVVSVKNVYYADNEEVENGPLSQTICVHQKPTRELFLNTLCHVNERYSAAEIISRSSFLKRHQLEVRWMDKHGLEMGVELRRSDNRLCCSKRVMEAKLTCFDDSRRRRVDRFCEDGYPDIPFTSFRATHMRNREKSCCFLLGENRYRCFAEKSDLLHGPTTTLLDFSQDETDPVNDLAEFASINDADVTKSVGSVTIGENKGKADNFDDDDKDDSAENEEKDDDDETSDKQKAMRSSTGAPAVTEARRPQVEIVRDFSSVGKSAPGPHGENHNPNDGTRANTKATVHGNPKQSSSERRKTGSKNGESAERVGSRKASSREYTAEGRRVNGGHGKRASGERTGKKRTSEEIYKPGPGSKSWVPVYEQTYSRGTGFSRERQGLSSAEKRERAKGSAQRRHDWAQVTEPGFEDQGGKSGTVTLDKIQKKMDRLLMQRQCCEAGAVAGRPVYGWFSPVRKECEHSGQKYIQAMDRLSGLRSCLEQFIKCCIELAVSGPVVTSSEFRENQFLFANNLRKLGPVGSLSRLDRGEDDWDETPARASREEFSRDIPGRDTPEAYERESEKRFQSMREVEVPTKDDNDDEENDGPKRFDKADNNVNKDFKIFDRKDETFKKTTKKAKGDEETEGVVVKDSKTKGDEETEDVVDKDSKIKGDDETDDVVDKDSKTKGDEETEDVVDKDSKTKGDEETEDVVDKDSKIKGDDETDNVVDKDSKTKGDEETEDVVDKDSKTKGDEETEDVVDKDSKTKGDEETEDVFDTDSKAKGDDETDDVVDKDSAAAEDVDKSGEYKFKTTNDDKKQKQEGESEEEVTRKQHKHPVTKVSLDLMPDLVDNTKKQDGDSSRQNEDSPLAKTSGGRSRKLRNNQDGGQSKAGKYSSREVRKPSLSSKEEINNLDRVPDLVDSMVKQDGDSIKQKEDSLLSKTSGGRSREMRHSRVGGQSKVGKSSSREIRQHLANEEKMDNLHRVPDLDDSIDEEDDDSSRQKEDSLLAKTSGGRSRPSRPNRVGGQSKAGKSSSGEARQQSTSRGTSQERRHYAHTYYSNSGSYKLAPSGKIGSEDSREMAAAHVRKFTGALDSKEMVDAYRKTSLKGFIKDGPKRRSNRRKYNRQSWYY